MPSETPAEYLRRVAEALGPLQEDAAEITGRFERALYSPDVVDAASVGELRRSVQLFKKELKKLPKSRPVLRPGVASSP